MNPTVKELWLRLAGRACLAAMLLVLFLLASLGVSRAAEIVPSLGVTRSLHGDDTDAKMFGGLAVRGDLAPLLKTEIGVAYRKETRLDGALEVRMWPVTASLWLTPLPTLYAGGGVGWYHTTFDYDPSLVAIPNETHEKFGSPGRRPRGSTRTGDCAGSQRALRVPRKGERRPAPGEVRSRLLVHDPGACGAVLRAPRTECDRCALAPAGGATRARDGAAFDQGDSVERAPAPYWFNRL
jgi:hypothetical protein